MPGLKSIISSRKEQKDAEKVSQVYANHPPTPPKSPEPTSSKEAPPSYEAQDPITNGPTQEELCSAFANLHIPSEATAPTTETCLAHLKLLHCFHALKEDVGYTDGLFGIWDARAELAENREDTLGKIREKRWSIYIARAVERFEDWWMKFLCPLDTSERLECKNMVQTNSMFAGFAVTEMNTINWTREMLPPIDVLMVWHSFMLNPRNYLEDCIRYGLNKVWATGMPWAAVNAAIDVNFNYLIPEQAQLSFITTTGHNWDNAQDSMTKQINCPSCSNKLEIPWTTFGMSEKPSKQEIDDLFATGYADKDLSYVCNKCSGEVNHDLLRVAKFKRETENLILRDWPLGGTILSPVSGCPDAPDIDDMKDWPPTFPNRMVQKILRSQVLSLISPENPQPNMDQIKELVEKAISSRDNIRTINGLSRRGYGTLRREEKISIRRMMSRYWENRSIFALELGGAVIRQSVFVEKMHGLDWLHSPAATQTMERLILKYSRFIHIMAKNPLHTVVPTLDVDLGWHTHQLSPKSYYDFTVKECEKFIDHDDKISEDALEKGFEFTSQAYEKLYQEVYSECTCWYCEAIRCKHTANHPKIFGTSKHEKIANNFHDSGAAQLCPPSNSAHISTHNAVKISDSTTRSAVTDRLRTRRQKELDDAYEKARKRAKAKGRDLPPKDQYYMAQWGYPYMMYGPYMAVPYYGGTYYTGDPCVMPVGAGMTGNCAAGSCGGAIGAGGCGGPGGCGG
ncbi:hypothetical protein HYFRA_00007564, partial [Hymenoscyphus fraxineus]